MPPPRRLPLLLLALTSVSSQKEGGGESLGGGLPGKVFGLGRIMSSNLPIADRRESAEWTLLFHRRNLVQICQF
jgi:hypothetical protein